MTGAELYKPGICASVLGVFLPQRELMRQSDGAVSHIMSFFHSGFLSAFAQAVIQCLGDVFVSQQILSSSYRCITVNPT